MHDVFSRWKRTILTHEAQQGRALGLRRQFNQWLQQALRGGDGQGVVDLTGSDSEGTVDLTRSDSEGTVDLTGSESDAESDAPYHRLLFTESDHESLRQARIWANSAQSQATVITIGGIDLLGQDFQRLLRPSPHDSAKYLNDSIIGAWMLLLQKRAEAQGQAHQVLFLNPGVGATWPTGRKITAKVQAADLLLLPFNLHGNHWVLLVTRRRAGTVQCYNSIYENSPEEQDLMHRMSQWVDERTAQPRPQSWTLSVADARRRRVRQGGHASQMPQQTNGYDCGVFTCLAADCLSQGEHVPDLEPYEVTLMRERLALRLAQGADSLVREWQHHSR